jgi:2,3-bisphosphoglycerate-dependent phosphoglycerate mutase
MHDNTLKPDETIEEKVMYFKKLFDEQGKHYEADILRNAIGYLSYKHAPTLPKEEALDKPVLYVFRHGQTDDNASFTFSGWREATLTEKGKKQTLILANKLKDKKIDMLYASPQIRAIDTMKLAISKNEAAKNLEIFTDERIKERDYGDLTGNSKLEYYLNDPESLELIRRSYTNASPNGESIEMVCNRVAEFCDEITKMMKDKNINVAVSCHGNSIRGFRKYFTDLNDYEIAHIETPLGQDYEAHIVE